MSIGYCKNYWQIIISGNDIQLADINTNIIVVTSLNLADIKFSAIYAIVPPIITIYPRVIRIIIILLLPFTNNTNKSL
jgi:hypothetical protein